MADVPKLREIKHASGEVLPTECWADPGQHGFYLREQKPDSVARFIREDRADAEREAAVAAAYEAAMERIGTFDIDEDGDWYDPAYRFQCGFKDGLNTARARVRHLATDPWRNALAERDHRMKAEGLREALEIAREWLEDATPKTFAQIERLILARADEIERGDTA